MLDQVVTRTWAIRVDGVETETHDGAEEALEAYERLGEEHPKAIVVLVTHDSWDGGYWMNVVAVRDAPDGHGDCDCE